MNANRLDPLNVDKTNPPADSAAHAASLSAGATFGQYRIVRLLGRGGMGEVYEAEHLTLGRRYALKLLPADFASRSDALERFRQEARVMANLEHPNIVKVDDFGETQGRYWLRMELAEGVEERAAASAAAGGPGSVPAAADTEGGPPGGSSNTKNSTLPPPPSTNHHSPLTIDLEPFTSINQQFKFFWS